jgi:ketosteroid isomerase-like protein
MPTTKRWRHGCGRRRADDHAGRFVRAGVRVAGPNGRLATWRGVRPGGRYIAGVAHINPFDPEKQFMRLSFAPTLLRTVLIPACVGLMHDALADATSDRSDVDHVLAAYHEAVVAGDADRLATLFLPSGSLWLNVLSDQAYAVAKIKSPGVARVKPGRFEDFAKLAAHNKGRFNPTHGDMKVSSDGTIASVYFDYAFMVDGKAANRGSETWQLVKGDDGWRIAALTYSSNPAW